MNHLSWNNKLRKKIESQLFALLSDTEVPEAIGQDLVGGDLTGDLFRDDGCGIESPTGCQLLTSTVPLK